MAGPDLGTRLDLSGDLGTLQRDGIVGRDAPGAGHAALHDMLVTQDYHDALPKTVRDHLVCRVVPELVPIVQKHDIEGLVMGTE